MLTFKPITMREAATLRRYYESCGFQLCEYSAGVKLMWRKNTELCVDGGGRLPHYPL